jgi:hypothetical protein
VPSLPNKIDPATREMRVAGRLAALVKGRRPTQPARWPGINAECSMKILSSTEVLACYAAAYHYFRDVLDVEVNAMTYSQFEEEILTQILFRACRDPQNADQTFATDVDDMRDHTTPDERAAVFTLYNDFRAEHDPDASEMTPALVRELDELVKKKDAATLRGFGSPVLVNYLLTTANRPSSSVSSSSDTTT